MERASMVLLLLDNFPRCVACKNRATMKQKCELRRCRVLNPEFNLKKPMGMLGVGAANGDVRGKARSSRRSAPPESRDESNDEDAEENEEMAGEYLPELWRLKLSYFTH